MNSLKNYLQELAAELRGRGMVESKVVDTLVELVSDPTLDRDAPASTYGSPREYAKQFEKTGARSRGFVAISVGVGIAIAIVLIKVVSSLVLGFETSLALTVATYSFAIFLALASVGLGSWMDRRLPSSVLNILHS